MLNEAGDGGGISNILNSALLNKQLGAPDYDQVSQNGLQVHDHLKSASMLKGQFYEDLMEDVNGCCGAFDDGLAQGGDPGQSRR